MRIKNYISSEYIIFGIILAFILPFSYLYASFGNYTYSIPLLLAAILYLSLFHKKSKNMPLRKIMIFFLILTVFTSINYYIYDLKYTTYPHFLANAIMPFVMFLVCFAYSSRNKSELLLILFFCTYYAIGIYYINYQQSIRESMLLQINNFYFVIAPLPFLFILEKPYLRSLFLIISTVCVIISLKRSGFVIIALLLAYTAYFYSFSKVNIKKKGIFFVLFAVVAFMGIKFMNSLDFEYYDRMLMRMEDIQEDGGSGRTDLFKESKMMIEKMSYIELLIGKGYSAADSERQVATGFHSFHNDYSEVMYSYGILGIILLVGFIINLFNKCRRVTRINSRYRFAMVVSFIIFLVFSFSSSVFHYTYFMLPLFMFWGYIDPKLKTERHRS